MLLYTDGCAREELSTGEEGSVASVLGRICGVVRRVEAVENRWEG